MRLSTASKHPSEGHSHRSSNLAVEPPRNVLCFALVHACASHGTRPDRGSTCCCCRPGWLEKLPSKTCRLLVKTCFQVVLLLYCLMVKLPRPDTVLVQNPPAVPTLMICIMACWWHNAKLVIDWHNFGYTIMSMTMGHRHPLVSHSPAAVR